MSTCTWTAEMGTSSVPQHDPAPVPCPSWCELPAGHPYDDPGHRHHVRSFGNDVEISSCENLENRVRTFTAPGIESDCDVWEGSPEEAEDLAASLTDAAMYLRTIQAAADADD